MDEEEEEKEDHTVRDVAVVGGVAALILWLLGKKSKGGGAYAKGLEREPTGCYLRIDDSGLSKSTEWVDRGYLKLGEGVIIQPEEIPKCDVYKVFITGGANVGLRDRTLAQMKKLGGTIKISRKARSRKK